MKVYEPKSSFINTVCPAIGCNEISNNLKTVCNECHFPNPILDYAVYKGP
jgi:hypothetical protein